MSETEEELEKKLEQSFYLERELKRERARINRELARLRDERFKREFEEGLRDG